jgi:hypothetical protein
MYSNAFCCCFLDGKALSSLTILLRAVPVVEHVETAHRLGFCTEEEKQNGRQEPLVIDFQSSVGVTDVRTDERSRKSPPAGKGLCFMFSL